MKQKQWKKTIPENHEGQENVRRKEKEGNGRKVQKEDRRPKELYTKKTIIEDRQVQENRKVESDIDRKKFNWLEEARNKLTTPNSRRTKCVCTIF